MVKHVIRLIRFDYCNIRKKNYYVKVFSKFKCKNLCFQIKRSSFFQFYLLKTHITNKTYSLTYSFDVVVRFQAAGMRILNDWEVDKLVVFKEYYSED